MNWTQRLSEGMTKTREAIRGSLDRLLGRGPDPMVLEELEATLIATDLGVRAVGRLMDRLREETRGGDPTAPAQTERLLRVLKEAILATLGACEGLPLAVGVNGVGKTTTLAKLAQRLRGSGKTPLLVAADTFRAAAIEQLGVWARRVGVEVIRHRPGADPSAVVFDGLAAAKARGADVVLIDTAGRLHTKTNLMDELRKMKRVLARELPGAPHEVLLVLDATTGQNALSQARQFH